MPLCSIVHSMWGNMSVWLQIQRYIHHNSIDRVHVLLCEPERHTIRCVCLMYGPCVCPRVHARVKHKPFARSMLEQSHQIHMKDTHSTAYPHSTAPHSRVPQRLRQCTTRIRCPFCAYVFFVHIPLCYCYCDILLLLFRPSRYDSVAERCAHTLCRSLSFAHVRFHHRCCCCWPYVCTAEFSFGCFELCRQWMLMSRATATSHRIARARNKNNIHTHTGQTPKNKQCARAIEEQYRYICVTLRARASKKVVDAGDNQIVCFFLCTKYDKQTNYISTTNEINRQIHDEHTHWYYDRTECCNCVLAKDVRKQFEKQKWYKTKNRTKNSVEYNDGSGECVFSGY